MQAKTLNPKPQTQAKNVALVVCLLAESLAGADIDVLWARPRLSGGFRVCSHNDSGSVKNLLKAAIAATFSACSRNSIF